MAIKFTQYMMPDGRTRDQWIDMEEDHPEAEEKARKIEAAGYYFEMEMLSDYKTCSFTIVHPSLDEGDPVDMACELAFNGPEVIDAIVKLIMEFEIPCLEK